MGGGGGGGGFRQTSGGAALDPKAWGTAISLPNLERQIDTAQHLIVFPVLFHC